MANDDWRGWADSTPSSTPTTPDKQGEPGPGKSNDWRGMPDSTPPSKPTTPDKQ